MKPAILLTALLLSWRASLQAADAAKARTNVVFTLADGLRPDGLAWFGNRSIRVLKEVLA